MPYSESQIIHFPKILDPRGNLTFIEGDSHIPFDIKRVFYLYDVPGGEIRTGHSNRNSQQFIIAMCGSFNVIVDTGSERTAFELNRAYYGLYLPRNVWREIDNFSSGAVCLVLTSTLYSPDEYIRDYDNFLEEVCGK